MAYSLLGWLTISPIASGLARSPFSPGGAPAMGIRTVGQLRGPVKENAVMATLIIVPRYIALMKNYSSKPRLTKWLKGHGQHVEIHEPLVVVETTKASLEIESPATGLVVALRAIQDKVNIGDTLGMIAVDQAEFDALIQEPRDLLLARQ
jgi:hypothetical protein